MLHGPIGEVECKLLITATSVKIGSGWKKLCTLHDLNVDNLEEIFLSLNICTSSSCILLVFFIFNLI